MSHWHVTWKRRMPTDYVVTDERYETDLLAMERADEVWHADKYYPYVEECLRAGCHLLPDTISARKDAE